MKKHKTRLGLDQVSTHAFFLFFITLRLQPLPLDNSFVKIRTSPLSSGGKDMADEPKHMSTSSPVESGALYGWEALM